MKPDPADCGLNGAAAIAAFAYQPTEQQIQELESQHGGGTGYGGMWAEELNLEFTNRPVFSNADKDTP